MFVVTYIVLEAVNLASLYMLEGRESCGMGEEGKCREGVKGQRFLILGWSLEKILERTGEVPGPGKDTEGSGLGWFISLLMNGAPESNL